ncbi:MAG TPA: DUF933 domain-containing protein [Candidatus Deferrimicrobium sp.]|nr:DUF933 domain-containing protein [Candidatus Deferrimicrobium sp.]
MKLGIVGKPQSGKTTLFNAASGRQEHVGDFSQAVHRAVIKVPDERLDKLAVIVKSPKVTHAEIEFLDAPGLTGHGRQAAPLEIGPELRQTDALILVADAFSPGAAPSRDIQDLLDEMLLTDQVLVEGSIARKEKHVKLTGDKTEAREMHLLHKVLETLEQQKQVIDLEWPDDDTRLLRGYMFLTQKPKLIALNIAEAELPQAGQWYQRFGHLVQAGRCDLTVVCARIEAELAVLAPEERQAFMTELGIAAPTVEHLIRKAYSLLGLISFITVEGPEMRAWPIKKGTHTLQAAGAVHSDIERGFIRAEVTACEDYLSYQTHAALKAAGKTRLEGKDYIVRDGDIIRFRFNV